jgi:hypothetical protein
MKLAVAALFAVCAFSAMAVSSASAFHPLFLTQSKTKLLFSGEGGKAVLTGLNLALVSGTVECNDNRSHGFVLNGSTLAREIHVEFLGECHELVSGVRTGCGEPITIKLAFGELGLVLGNKTVGILLAPETGKEFTKFTCGTESVTVEGAVIGEFPETVGGVNQYNKDLKTYIAKFESVGKKSDLQNPESIELLGTQMTKVELKTTGFFGGRASEEAEATLTLDGEGLIDTK